MNNQQKLKAVTEAIHKACPDLCISQTSSGFFGINQDGEPIRPRKKYKKSIGIAEVLRAIDKVSTYYSISSFGFFEKWKLMKSPDEYKLLNSPNHKWNLTKTLDQQEEPVINLIFNILCK